jgi:hypothetical protein
MQPAKTILWTAFIALVVITYDRAMNAWANRQQWRGRLVQRGRTGWLGGEWVFWSLFAAAVIAPILNKLWEG